MTQAQQPEALRLADELDEVHQGYADEGPSTFSEAAAELRRLHHENTALQQGYDAARLEIESLHARVQELEREAHSLRKDAERFRFANESEEDFAICYWDENMGNGGEWMCYSDKGDAIEVLDAAIRASGAQGESNG